MTVYSIFKIKKKITLYPKSAAMGFFSNGLKNEFKTAMVNKPSVFQPLKFYCTLRHLFKKVVESICNFWGVRSSYSLIAMAQTPLGL